MNKWVKFINEGQHSAAGIVVCVRSDSRFLILRRSDIDRRAGDWTLPGGHIDDEDCTIEDGAARELYEEANLRCEACDLTYLGQPKPEKFYFLATKWDGEVNVDKPNPKTDEIEHDAYKWATIDDIKDIEDTEIPIYLLEKALDMLKNAK